MKITLTDNLTTSLLEVIGPSLRKATDVKFGVAFATRSGFALVEDGIDQCLAHGGRVEFLLGLDFRTTEPIVLRRIVQMGTGGLDVHLYCFSDPSLRDSPVFHPKIYLVREADKCVFSVGSSNLTSGGLRDNAEVNAVVEADTADELISDAYGIYNRLKFQRSRFQPDLEYIQAYEDVYAIARKKDIDTWGEIGASGIVNALKAREQSLPRTEATEAALFGWQQLVYQRLPTGAFHTSDIYAYEAEFQKSYPQNNYIRDKIRQILQQLRDLGLLKHVGHNQWSKD